MLPYSATDAINAMTTAYGIKVEDVQPPQRRRVSRLLRWLRSLA